MIKKKVAYSFQDPATKKYVPRPSTMKKAVNLVVDNKLRVVFSSSSKAKKKPRLNKVLSSYQPLKNHLVDAKQPESTEQPHLVSDPVRKSTG